MVDNEIKNNLQVKMFYEYAEEYMFGVRFEDEEIYWFPCVFNLKLWQFQIAIFVGTHSSTSFVYIFIYSTFFFIANAFPYLWYGISTNNLPNTYLWTTSSSSLKLASKQSYSISHCYFMKCNNAENQSEII